MDSVLNSAVPLNATIPAAGLTVPLLNATVPSAGLHLTPPFEYVQDSGLLAPLPALPQAPSDRCKAAKKKSGASDDVPTFYVVEDSSLAPAGTGIIATPQIAYNDAAGIMGEDYSPDFVLSADKPDKVKKALAAILKKGNPPTKAHTVDLPSSGTWLPQRGKLKYKTYPPKGKEPWVLHWLKCYRGTAATKTANRQAAGCIPPNIFWEPELALLDLKAWHKRASCDEYPFASSKEGGGGSIIRGVPEEENTNQGINLSSFTNKNIVTLAHHNGVYQVCVILSKTKKVGDGCKKHTYDQLKALGAYP